MPRGIPKNPKEKNRKLSAVRKGKTYEEIYGDKADEVKAK